MSIDPLYDLELEANNLQAENNRRMRELLKRKTPLPTPVEDIPEVITITDSVTPPWMSLMTFPSHLSDEKGTFFFRLHQEICAFSKWVEPTRDEVCMRAELVETVTRAVRKIHKAADVAVFGSVYTGLCLPTADLDLAVTGLTIKHLSRKDKKHLMKRLAKILVDDKVAAKVEVVDTARVPIVKIVTLKDRVSIDIAFGLDRNPRRTSDWVKAQIAKFPALKPLVLILKVYLMLRNFNEPFYGGIGSYLLVALVVAFLKNHASMRNSTVFSACNLGHLLFDFFRFFGEELDEENVGFASNGSLQPNKYGSLLSCESPDDPYLDLGQPAFEYSEIKKCFRNTYFALCAQPTSFSVLSAPELLGQDFSWADRKEFVASLEVEISDDTADEVIAINPRVFKGARQQKVFVVDESSDDSPKVKRSRLNSWEGQQWSDS